MQHTGAPFNIQMSDYWLIRYDIFRERFVNEKEHPLISKAFGIKDEILGRFICPQYNMSCKVNEPQTGVVSYLCH